MLFTFRVLDAKLKKLLHTMDNTFCDPLNREKRTKYEILQRTKRTPLHAARTEEVKQKADNGRNRMCRGVSWIISGIVVFPRAGRFGGGSCYLIE